MRRPPLLALALALAACAGAEAEAPPRAGSDPANLLVNPGFEGGRAGWSVMPNREVWRDFAVVEGPARSGRRAAHLPVRAERGERGTARIFGVVQELRPDRFPDRVAGWYRVEGWSNDSASTDLYLQVVAVVWDDVRSKEYVTRMNPTRGLSNYQIRYYLAGLDGVPFQPSNARVVFVLQGEPPQGVWVPFQIPLAEDFERRWGAVPRDYAFLRILFEARWDNRVDGRPLHADVYFDDLFVGYADD